MAPLLSYIYFSEPARIQKKKRKNEGLQQEQLIEIWPMKSQYAVIKVCLIPSQAHWLRCLTCKHLRSFAVALQNPVLYFESHLNQGIPKQIAQPALNKKPRRSFFTTRSADVKDFFD